ncbi:cytochrome c oxidase assembly protein [Phragmitibacter flavus]|uniref:Cytochrome c oxidase assembly protein n=1 Tax=Phragmitibacter flavus TaxID=2576071 RepID=A0A5R8KGC9_9BACT|nr:cytochrome c oxidase assembly protein [Phragmitibacter flavus]TLD71367.1 cytochrome c oxidase assembly protein [Phragmitibacter flavus]
MRRGAGWMIIVVLWFAGVDVAWAHGAPRAPYEGPWWLAWNWSQPVVVVNLSVLCMLYAAGLCRLWQRSGVGRSVSKKQAGSFAMGMLVLWMALISPIDVYSDELAWMHMIQHMLLLGVVAPLLVMGSPFFVAMWALPLAWRRRYGDWQRWVQLWKPARYLLWQPLMLWCLFGLTMWVWHLPPLYEATLYDDLFHDFQHFTFVLVGCLFWRVLLDPVSRLRLGRGMAVLYLFLTSLHATLLGVFMTLAPKVWYPFYESRAPRWKLSALEDQQIAGLIMWMPACMVYAGVAAVLLWMGLREDEDKKGQRGTAPLDRNCSAGE